VGHDRGVTSELHLHPDRLRVHATLAAALADELHAHLPGPDLPAAALLTDGLRRAVAELGELSAVTAAAAARASTADGEIARALRHGGGP
jgi:hypothetical protein